MSLYTPFNKWVTDEHKLFTDSVQKFYNDEMRPNIEDWVNKGFVSKTFCRPSISNYKIPIGYL